MSSVDFSGKLVVAISSRALFDLDDCHAVYEQEGVEAYRKYQVANENNVLKPGAAFPLVKKLLALNDSQEETLVEVILMSRNSSDTGLRIFNSIQHYELGMTRAAFTSGCSPHRYGHAFGAHLFLSADIEDVKHALRDGYAAARVLPVPDSTIKTGHVHKELRIAFDGDAVLFSDEAERVFKKQGLEAFQTSESAAATRPLSEGPFKGFLQALHLLQARYPTQHSPLRTALVTARSAPAHERVIRTLRSWDIRLDEALFLGGLAKGEFLEAFGADIFFDDQKIHCESANQHVATGFVPHGVANETKDAP